MIAWFARNHVAANILMVSIFIAGLFSLSQKVPLEVFPSIEFDMVSVSVSMRGASPQDMEQGVAILLEQAIEDLDGLEKVVSRSVEGLATLNIDISDGHDAKEILTDIKNRIDAISNLPLAADRPVVSLSQRRREVISVVVAGEVSELEIRQKAEQVRDELVSRPGISQVDLDGVRNYEIAIEVSQFKLQQYQMTLQDVSTAVKNESSDLTAGNLRTSGSDILISSRGQRYSRPEFEDIVVKASSDGGIVRLKDIAVVHDGFEETPLRTRFNGKPAAMIDVYRIGQESAISVADQVKQYIQEQQGNLPQGMELSYWDDDSEIVKKRLNTLLVNAAQGGVLVLALLALFLRPAIAFWVFIGIPISFMGAFVFMPLLGISLNIVSLFGFILVLGIVVDDAIVTGENVYRHLRQAESGLDAAVRGTQEVAVPVTFGVLTTVVAFLPLAFIEGHRGAIFGQIPAVIIPVLLLSLVESKFVLPAHLKYIKLRHEKNDQGRLEKLQEAFADGFERIILDYYRPLLKVTLRYRYTALAVSIGILIIILAALSSGWMRFIFFPKVPSETARVTVTMPSGTAFEVTDQFVLHITEKAQQLQEKYRDAESGKSVIQHIFATTGSAGSSSNIGRVRFEITPAEERELDITSIQLVNEWRKLIGPVPGAESLAFRAEIGRSSDPVDIQLSGNDLKVLEEVSEQVKKRLATYPYIFDITDSLADGKQELRVELKPQAYLLGLNRTQVVQQLQQAYLGIEVQRIQRGREEIKVLVRLPGEERDSEVELKDFVIFNNEGQGVPLDHIAWLKPAKSPSAIYRIGGFRTLNVTADLDKSTANTTVLTKDLREYLDQLTQQYPSVSYELEGEAKEQDQSFGSLFWGLLLVLGAIYTLLAIPFASYMQPFIVMSVIPFGLIGAVIGHWIMGMPLTIMSVMGLLALTGVVVNDSLVLVDFVNKTRGRMDLKRALLTAAPARFRPVMLTSMTTFIGLMPLLFEKSTRAQFLIPMAVSLGFGILFATLITLLLIPVNYMILEDIKALKNKLFAN
ncbi:efflux RND transporter permease subunit [Oceanospirillum beijerinckii]|uniref:efflux RND transporter permease subunit n=1 Tax=Oceanospirillum beijerinckii TaxID=64976 RepID=UPI0004225F36|nr:efflux RND transporter permease subunit [Oceanospirillum beijerinckii]